MHTTGQLTNTRSSDGTPDLDGGLREVSRKKMILQVDYMMILVVYYSCTLTVKLRLLLTKYLRNRINFAFFVRSATLILKGQWG